MSADRVSSEEQRAFEQMTEVFDDVYMLSGKIACEDECTLPSDIQRSIDELNQRLAAYSEFDFNFSGTGFMPLTFPDGSVQTVYTHTEQATGKFSELYLSEEEMIDFVGPEELDDSEDEEEEGQLIIVGSPRIDELRDRLVVPPEGMRLYADFLLHTDHNERPIAGSSVRTQHTETYAMMNTDGLTINGMERSRELIDPDDMEKVILDEAKKLRGFLKSTDFRRKSRRSQTLTLDRILSDINARLQLSHYSVLVCPEEFYIPELSEDNHRMRRHSPPDYFPIFQAYTQHVDTLEHLALSSGRRITKDTTMVEPEAGLCIVAEVDPHVQEVLQINSSVIWLPVKFKKLQIGGGRSRRIASFSGEFFEKGLQL